MERSYRQPPTFSLHEQWWRECQCLSVFWGERKGGCDNKLRLGFTTLLVDPYEWETPEPQPYVLLHRIIHSWRKQETQPLIKLAFKQNDDDDDDWNQDKISK